MTAAYVEELGPAGAIRVGPLPTPGLGSTDVLVAVDTVTVNPVDTYVRSGRYATSVPLPFIVGRDLVGNVAEVGDAVTDFTPGQQVWCNSMGHDGRQGSFSQLCAVPAERLYRLPQHVDSATAVAAAHPAATAYLGLFVHGRMRPGQTVFVGGGAGNVGTAVIEMATYAGARVVASARPQDHEQCRRAGAEVVLDYRGLDAEALTEADGRAIDLFWDTSGHTDFALAARTLAVGGRIVVSAAASEASDVPFAALYTRDVDVHGFVISRATVQNLASAARLINQMLVDDRLTARITDRLPLSQAAAAHERMEHGEVRGRLLLDLGESEPER
jgi:NADPH:quinone reductase-like Zn-dependent oxidoreductase